MEGDFGQAVGGHPHIKRAGEANFAFGDEEVDERFEIRIERAQFQIVNVEFYIGGWRSDLDFGIDANRSVGVPAKRDGGGLVGAGNVRKIPGGDGDVID